MTRKKLPSEADFRAYEMVRSGGRHNMLGPLAQTATGLSKPAFAAVQDNYAKLMRKYPNVRK